MPADLMLSDGRYSIVYNALEGLPWHELGQPVAGAPTIPEALSLAGLDYQVEKRKIFYPIYGEDGETVVEQPEVPNFYATVNARTNGVLGIVGNRYTVLQNEEAFAALEPLVEEGTIQLDVAGALGEHGKKIWILAKIGEPYEIATDDKVLTYLLLVNTHDGSQSLRIIATPIRVVCANTERMARASQRHEYTLNVRHTSAIERRTAEATTIVRLALEHHKEFRKVAQWLARKAIDKKIVTGLLGTLYPDLETTAPGDRPRIERAATKIVELLEEEPIAAVRGTAWSLYNAVTGYVDHHRPTRGHSDTNRLYNRLNSMWFGPGARMKDAAMSYLLEAVA